MKQKESAADYVVSNTDYTILEVMRPIHLSPSSHSSTSVSEATPSAHKRELDHLVPICTLSPCPPNYLTEVHTAVLDEGSVDDLTETSEVEKCNASVDTKRGKTLCQIISCKMDVSQVKRRNGTFGKKNVRINVASFYPEYIQ